MNSEVLKSDGWDSVISRHQQARLSYDKLDRDSNALARGLARTGVKKGDRIAVSLGNNTEFATVGPSSAMFGITLTEPS